MRHLVRLTVLIFLLFTSMVTAQDKPYMDFSEKELNFGTIRAVDGKITHGFTFRNTGKIPLIINDVKSSCGCTVSEWTREPVLPGKEGKISIVFNPSAQSGAVSKNIQVISNASNSPFSLSIHGVVVPSEKVEDIFKFTIGDLRLETIYAAFGEISKGTAAEYTIKVFNNSHEDPAVVAFGKVPPHLSLSVEPAAIEPRQEGLIRIKYNTKLIDTWDYNVDRINLLINGKSVQGNRLNVTANIREDFSGLTAEQLAMSAHAEYDSREFNFGQISDNQVVEHVFHLKNTGRSDLYIRKVSASCGCTAVQPSKVKVAPGDSTEIKAVFNARGREGSQKKAITVITNDPKQSRSILWINAVVVKSDHPNP